MGVGYVSFAYFSPSMVVSPPSGLIDRETAALLAIRTLLIDSGLFTSATCLISLDDQPFPAPSLPCAWITPGNASFDKGLNYGGGRYETMVAFEFSVRVVLRRLSDIESQDIQLLTNPARGGFPIVFAVTNVLTEQFLYDTGARPLTSTGLKPVSRSKPYRYGKDPMLGVVEIRFTTDILIDLNVPDP